MYNSGIVPEVIALQMDKSKEEIIQIIDKTKAEEEEKNKNKKNKRNKVGYHCRHQKSRSKKIPTFH
jgi:hypothetical protein